MNQSGISSPQSLNRETHPPRLEHHLAMLDLDFRKYSMPFFGCINVGLTTLLKQFQLGDIVLELHMRKLPCWESSDQGWGHLRFLIVARVRRLPTTELGSYVASCRYSTFGDFHETLFGVIFVLLNLNSRAMLQIPKKYYILPNGEAG